MTYNEFVVENLGCEDEGVYRLNRIKLENTQVRGGQLVFLWGGGGVEGAAGIPLRVEGAAGIFCWAWALGRVFVGTLERIVLIRQSL